MAVIRKSKRAEKVGNRGKRTMKVQMGGDEPHIKKKWYHFGKSKKKNYKT